MDYSNALLALVLLTALFRTGEIVLGEINAHAMLKKGGREFSPWQRPPVFIAYALWLAALLFYTPVDQEIRVPFLILFGLLQCLRWWAIAHLKHYWTTRIIIVPLAWKVASGPYAFLRHPIYIALAGEVMALSLAFDQWAVGCLFSGIVFLWVFIRVKAESRALNMML